MEVRRITSKEFIGSCNFCDSQENARYQLTGPGLVVRLCGKCAEELKLKLQNRNALPVP